ncbi:MAG: hypothetical protein KDA58_00950 [Planctomycetaceae bacterium]|nr:hypothetical protein [Planctomycetaceae bacterium]
MSHSHLPIRHLVRQIEKSRELRDLGTVSVESDQRTTPERLLTFIEQVAERFEPFQGVARVGFEACHADDAWEIAMFLGEKELMGGATDGRLVPINFRFDLGNLTNCFSKVTGLFWNAFPNSHVCFEDAADLSFVTVEGDVEEYHVRLQLHAAPPDCVGPAFREHCDGRVELV